MTEEEEKTEVNNPIPEPPPEETEPLDPIFPEPLNSTLKTEPCPPPLLAQLCCFTRVANGQSASYEDELLAWLVLPNENAFDQVNSELANSGTHLSIKEPTPAEAEAFINNLLMRTRGVTHG